MVSSTHQSNYRIPRGETIFSDPSAPIFLQVLLTNVCRQVMASQRCRDFSLKFNKALGAFRTQQSQTEMTNDCLT